VDMRALLSFGPSVCVEYAYPDRVRAAVPSLSLRPVMVCMTLLSTMLVRMLAARKGLEDIVSCPAQLPHAGFRGVIRSADPALQILEVLLKSELLPCRA